MLATASDDKTAKVIEFKTGKVLFTGTTPDNSKLLLIIILFWFLYIAIRGSKIGMLHLAAATERVVLKIKRYYFEDDHWDFIAKIAEYEFKMLISILII